MKVVVYGPDERVGALIDDNIIDLNLAYAKYAREAQDEPLPNAMASAMAPANLADFIAGGPRAIESAEIALDHLKRTGDYEGLRGEKLRLEAKDVRLHPPLVSRGTRIMNAGGNFADHSQGSRLRRQHREVTLEEVRNEAIERGMWGFNKLAVAAIGQDEPLQYPAHGTRLDYEGEVAMVFGKSIKDFKGGDLSPYIWGYTLQNDFSLRDQREPQGGSYAFGKNFDGCSALGPCIIVGELSDPQDIPFKTHVNGELRQSGNTRDMIFSFADWVENLSRRFTINPGDILSGGTCAGTGMDSSEYDEKGVPDPKLFLKPGDVIEVSSPAIGSLRNRVV
jgi:acylpyruvate hydrolase